MKPRWTHCWRCDVKTAGPVGVPCGACRVILHAAYDAARRANGGHLLYIPDDWDGPAVPVGQFVMTCPDCHEDFSSAHPCNSSVPRRCPDCQHVSIVAGVRAYRARLRAEGPPRRPYRSGGAWAVDVSNI